MDKQISYETCSTLTIDSYSSFNENSYLIEKIKNDDDDKENNSIYNKISSSLIAMLQGVEVLCNLSILYIFKDNYKLHPATLSVVLSLIKLPWSIKLLWAIISDSFPVCGFRRKYYLLVGSLVCILSLLMLGWIHHKNITVSVGLLMMYFFGSSLCNVIGEAQVVESSRRGTVKCSAKNVSIFFAFRKLSFAIMSYLSGYLLSVMTKQHIFLIGSMLPTIVFISSFFTTEKKSYRKCSVKEQVRCVYKIVKMSHVKNFIIFIFLLMSMPSCGNTLFFYMTNELNFSPNLLGKMAMFQSLASLIAILSYMFLFSTIDVTKLILYSTIIITPFGLLPLIVVKKINLLLNLPSSLFIITDTILVEFIAEFQTMPILVQCSRIIPEGFESTIYSLFLSANNLAIITSSFLTSLLTYQLQITSKNFNNLPLMIIICCLTNIIPITFLCLFPVFNNNIKSVQNIANSPPPRTIYESTHCASSDNSDADEETHLSRELEVDALPMAL
ncbi:folate transporter 1 [Plasmodium gonderi]|uniref:Folate transporter 1 n=1 Tax=Plasmodium gonderi TaxID=77519 RepID=A0A1Y1JBJ9_PLAGO|nr:folate transporter 1 [Plasmodium gonderi]GAW79620.1 folate transporter 1 [Plasmodium gonderi]